MLQSKYQNPKVRAKIVKAIIGISQQKKAIIKQRLTSSVSIFFTSPYFTINIAPRAAIPTTTIDQPTISHLKNSDKRIPLIWKKNLYHFSALKNRKKKRVDQLVIPTEAGIQVSLSWSWIPVFTGMTEN